jgi:hypothetical protein
MLNDSHRCRPTDVVGIDHGEQLEESMYFW